MFLPLWRLCALYSLEPKPVATRALVELIAHIWCRPRWASYTSSQKCPLTRFLQNILIQSSSGKSYCQLRTQRTDMRVCEDMTEGQSEATDFIACPGKLSSADVRLQPYWNFSPKGAQTFSRTNIKGWRARGERGATANKIVFSAAFTWRPFWCASLRCDF